MLKNLKKLWQSTDKQNEVEYIEYNVSDYGKKFYKRFKHEEDGTYNERSGQEFRDEVLYGLVDDWWVKSRTTHMGVNLRIKLIFEGDEIFSPHFIHEAFAGLIFARGWGSYIKDYIDFEGPNTELFCDIECAMARSLPYSYTNNPYKTQSLKHIELSKKFREDSPSKLKTKDISIEDFL